jgi:hypothetical protein
MLEGGIVNIGMFDSFSGWGISIVFSGQVVANIFFLGIVAIIMLGNWYYMEDATIVRCHGWSVLVDNV